MRKDLTESKIYCILLILACMNFRAHGSIIFIALAAFAIVKFQLHLSVDWCGVVAFALMLSIFIAALIHYDVTECIKSINYFFSYMIGFEGVRQAKAQSKFIKRSIFSIFLGTGLFLFLELYYNVGKVFESNRLLLNVWTGDYISVTLVGLVSSVVIGYACYGILFSKNAKLAILSGGMLFVAVILNFRTATRTPFVIIAILLITLVWVRFREQNLRSNVKLFIKLSLAVLAVIIAIQFNIMGLKTLIFSSNLYARFQATDSMSRIDIAHNHFQYVLEYPFGGRNIASLVGMAAHNLLQEGYDLYGGFAALCELILSIFMGKNIIILARKKGKDKCDWLLLCMYVPMLIQCYLEPVHEGFAILFWSLLMIHGMTNAYLNGVESAENCGVNS